MRLFLIIKSFINHPIGKRSLFLSFKKFLFFQIYFRVMKGEYLYSWINDSKFFVSPGETGITGNLYFGLHEFEDMSFLLHYINDKDVFFDIGSNVGSYTILSGVVKRCTVHSFEPNPQTFIKLKRNLSVNPEGLKINLHNVGLGAKKGYLMFTNYNVSTLNHVVIDNKEENVVKVKIETLDHLGIIPNIIKIDVEGFEHYVIKGGLKTLKNENLKCIIIELNDSGKKYSQNKNDVFEQLKSLGFKSYKYSPFKKELTPIDGINNSGNNTLLLRGSLDFFNKRLSMSEKYVVNDIKI